MSARKLRGWSQDDLAREIRKRKQEHGLASNMGRQRVYCWENGHDPTDESQLYLSEVFDVPWSDVKRYGWPHWLPGQHQPVDLGSVPAATVLRDAIGNLSRRSAIAASSGALIALCTQWSQDAQAHQLDQALTGDTPCGTGLVDWLEEASRTLTALPTADRQHTVDLIDAHLSTATTLIETGVHDEPTTLRLHALAARLGQTAGWTRFDVGEHGSAGRLWEGALHAAHAAGATDLGTSVLADFAYQAIWLRDPSTAIGLLDRTLDCTTHPRARALLHVRKARAHAISSDERLCYRSLHACEELLDASSPDPVPAWCSWMSPADYLIDAGRCFLDFGDLRAGVSYIDNGLAELQTPRAKTSAIFQTYQAEALARAGQPEHAAAVLTASLDTAKRIGATRCVELARQAAPAFNAYRDLKPVSTVLARLQNQ
ncbi:helix-turn-helix transcriptional regulator [Kitasatospora sp. NPDC094028]